MIQKTDNVNIGTFINTCPLLVVPKFQRDYAWEEEEIRDFVEDWQDLVHEHAQSSAAAGHFLGGLVTIESNQNSNRIYEIVDGQQRLTTIFLATWKLRHQFLSIHKEAGEAGNELYEVRARNISNSLAQLLFNKVQNQYGDEESQLRLHLSRQDKGFFRSLISDLQPTPQRASHHRLKDAADNIQKWIVSDMLGETEDLIAKFDLLVSLRTRLYEDCHLLHISSSNRSQAYRLFAVLNDRGKTLSDGDQLRWYSMDLIDSNGAAEESLGNVSDYWDEILSGRPSQIRAFLEAYYPSRTGARAKKNAIADGYRKQFFSYTPPLSIGQVDEVKAQVLDMHSHMETYRKLADGAWPYENSGTPQWTQKRLERLIKDLKHTLCMPLLLAAHDELSEEQFAQLVLALEKFVFRYITMVGAKPGSLYPTYHDHAKKIRGTGNSYDVSSLFKDLRSLAERNAPDTEFEEALRGGKLSYMPASQRRVTRYFLTTLNDHCRFTKIRVSAASAPNQMAVIDPGQVNVEHIYPQNANLSDRDTALEALKHDIGNLTFWAPQDNKKAGNKLFKDKKAEYRKSNATMTKALGEEPAAWTKSKILKRRDEMVKAALRVFKI